MSNSFFIVAAVSLWNCDRKNKEKKPSESDNVIECYIVKKFNLDFDFNVNLYLTLIFIGIIYPFHYNGEMKMWEVTD